MDTHSKCMQKDCKKILWQSLLRNNALLKACRNTRHYLKSSKCTCFGTSIYSKTWMYMLYLWLYGAFLDILATRKHRKISFLEHFLQHLFHVPLTAKAFRAQEPNFSTYSLPSQNQKFLRMLPHAEITGNLWIVGT